MDTGKMIVEDADFPPLSPMGEAPAPNDGTFIRDCLDALHHIGALGDVQAGASAFTVNRIWGPVFRMDFTIDGKPESGSVNRLICWRQANGAIGTTYAIGQAVPPLPAR